MLRSSISVCMISALSSVTVRELLSPFDQEEEGNAWCMTLKEEGGGSPRKLLAPLRTGASASETLTELFKDLKDLFEDTERRSWGRGRECVVVMELLEACRFTVRAVDILFRDWMGDDAMEARSRSWSN